MTRLADILAGKIDTINPVRDPIRTMQEPARRAITQPRTIVPDKPPWPFVEAALEDLAFILRHPRPANIESVNLAMGKFIEAEGQGQPMRYQRAELLQTIAALVTYTAALEAADRTRHRSL